MNGARPGQAGFTLIEVLVTVAVIGIAFATVVGGIGTSILTSDYQRKQARSQNVLRGFAEAIKTAAVAYTNCATTSSYANAYTPPASQIRTVTDGVLSQTATVTSATAAFTSADLGKPIAATGIPAGATIESVVNATTVTMSAAATTTATAVAVTIGEFPYQTSVTAVKYWNGASFVTTCPASDAGLQLISLRVQAADQRDVETVDIVKRRP